MPWQNLSEEISEEFSLLSAPPPSVPLRAPWTAEMREKQRAYRKKRKAQGHKEKKRLWTPRDRETRRAWYQRTKDVRNEKRRAKKEKARQRPLERIQSDS